MSLPPCRHGAGCTDFGEEHRATIGHPEGVTLACQYGKDCFRKNVDHLRQFVHPGDRNYRVGMVHFPVRKGKQVQPVFQTMRDLFNYCDPDESGNISQEEFKLAWEQLQEHAAGFEEARSSFAGLSLDVAWRQAAGEDSTHLTFAQFARWASEQLLRLPVGMDLGESADKLCRFNYAGGKRCPCAKFQASEAAPSLCTCGHKASMHLSDVAFMTHEEQEILSKLSRGGRAGPTGSFRLAPASKPGVTMVTNKDVLKVLQDLLTNTFKSSDNWTRDRGCSKHGRNNCPSECIMKNRAPVPAGFKLMRAERNRNPALWQTFATTRAAVKSEREDKTKVRVWSSYLDIPGEESLDDESNEWRLMHGTSLQACKGICQSNFRLKLAGSGATWKDSGKKAGKPLYGYGIYLAESSTKADEYADVITGSLPADEGCCCMLVCRAVGGMVRLVDTNEFDTEELRTDVLDGPFHSVFGDRTSKLGKPYREVVVYDSAQVFPEYILYYMREWPS